MRASAGGGRGGLPLLLVLGSLLAAGLLVYPIWALAVGNRLLFNRALGLLLLLFAGLLLSRRLGRRLRLSSRRKGRGGRARDLEGLGEAGSAEGAGDEGRAGDARRAGDAGGAGRAGAGEP